MQGNMLQDFLFLFELLNLKPHRHYQITHLTTSDISLSFLQKTVGVFSLCLASLFVWIPLCLCEVWHARQWKGAAVHWTLSVLFCHALSLLAVCWQQPVLQACSLDTIFPRCHMVSFQNAKPCLRTAVWQNVSLMGMVVRGSRFTTTLGKNTTISPYHVIDIDTENGIYFFSCLNSIYCHSHKSVYCKIYKATEATCAHCLYKSVTYSL